MNSTAVIVGVDAGVTGAVAWWDGTEMHVSPLPIRPDRTLDALALVTQLIELSPVLLVAELTFKPLQLVRMTGEILACGKVVGAAVEMPAVASWKKAVCGRVTSDKELSISVCKSLYPNVNLLPTPRCKKPSHDIAESVLQCHFGRILWEGNKL